MSNPNFYDETSYVGADGVPFTPVKLSSAVHTAMNTTPVEPLYSFQAKPDYELPSAETLLAALQMFDDAEVDLPTESQVTECLYCNGIGVVPDGFGGLATCLCGLLT